MRTLNITLTSIAKSKEPKTVDSGYIFSYRFPDQNYKLKTRLFDILYPNNKNNTFIFLNNNSNDYRKQNIKINTPHKYLDIFPEPKNYTILEYGSPYKIIAGKYSGQYRNMYWKVKNNNLIYYLMHIKDDIYTKISLDDIDKVLYFKNTRSSYYIHSNGYIATTVNSDRCFYYLHQLIMDVHDENLSDFTKTVDHINRDKLDNRRGNLRSVDMSIQNSNRDKSERRKDAIELPNGINQSDLPKYIVYRKEILNKNNEIMFFLYFVHFFLHVEKRVTQNIKQIKHISLILRPNEIY